MSLILVQRNKNRSKYKTTLFIFIEYSLRCRSAHIRKNHGLNPITDEIEIKKIKKIFFCINVNKNAKEKLSFGFWVTKIKTDTTRARFPNSW